MGQILINYKDKEIKARGVTANTNFYKLDSIINSYRDGIAPGTVDDLYYHRDRLSLYKNMMLSLEDTSRSDIPETVGELIVGLIKDKLNCLSRGTAIYHELVSIGFTKKSVTIDWENIYPYIEGMPNGYYLFPIQKLFKSDSLEFSSPEADDTRAFLNDLVAIVDELWLRGIRQSTDKMPLQGLYTYFADSPGLFLQLQDVMRTASMLSNASRARIRVGETSPKNPIKKAADDKGELDTYNQTRSFKPLSAFPYATLYTQDSNDGNRRRTTAQYVGDNATVMMVIKGDNEYVVTEIMTNISHISPTIIKQGLLGYNILAKNFLERVMPIPEGFSLSEIMKENDHEILLRSETLDEHPAVYGIHFEVGIPPELDQEVTPQNLDVLKLDVFMNKVVREIYLQIFPDEVAASKTFINKLRYSLPINKSSISFFIPLAYLTTGTLSDTTKVKEALASSHIIAGMLAEKFSEEHPSNSIVKFLRYVPGVAILQDYTPQTTGHHLIVLEALADIYPIDMIGSLYNLVPLEFSREEQKDNILLEQDRRDIAEILVTQQHRAAAQQGIGHIPAEDDNDYDEYDDNDDEYYEEDDEGDDEDDDDED